MVVREDKLGSLEEIDEDDHVRHNTYQPYITKLMTPFA